MKIYHSNTISNPKNAIYPSEIDVVDISAFEKAVSYDHVMAKYKHNYRSNDNFMESDCIAMDIDNDYSENSNDWVDVEDLKTSFDDVKFGIVYSRNHNKEKGGRAARPRLHIYFPIPKVDSLHAYIDIKEMLASYFPYFDKQALDGARFFYGVEKPVVEIVRGNKYVTEILMDDFEDWEDSQDLIEEGSRNSTMSHFAGKVLIRYGDSDEARRLFDKKALYCSPPLSDHELESIWNSALKFYKKISSSDDYIPPEKYNETFDDYKPKAFTDIAVAEVFVKHNSDRACYTVSSGWLYWNGKKWEESELKVIKLYMKTAKKVLKNASFEMHKAYQDLANAQLRGTSDEINKVKSKVSQAKSYVNFAKKINDHGKVTGIIKLSRSLLEIPNEMLDKDPFILNTPEGIVDLKTGKISEHDPSCYCTKMTSVTPSSDFMEMWFDALDGVTGLDKEYQYFLKCHAGSCLIGHVYEEALLIVYGEGGNGKSTIFNSEAHVLGDYAGKIPAESLTTRAKNVKVDLAELTGKRFVLASETEEGQRLSISMLKQIASVDEISAERKYYSPFKFTPTHSTILYTNHLPKVGSSDKGTWRRIVVAPFTQEIKNPRTDYIDELIEKAGGAILTWMIEGARHYIDNGFMYPKCQVVEDAKSLYREENDWISHFITDWCVTGINEKEMSSTLYQAYREWSNGNGEYTRNNRDFSTALLQVGFKKKRTSRGIVWQGISINENRGAEEDFL